MKGIVCSLIVGIGLFSLSASSQAASEDQPQNQNQQSVANFRMDMIEDVAADHFEITSVTETVPAGRTAIFNLELKLSNPLESQSGQLTIILPIGYILGNDLTDLRIGDSEPIYQNNQLVYQFVNLSQGISLNKKIFIKTVNGVTPNNQKIVLKGNYETDNLKIVAESPEVSILSKASFAVTNKIASKIGSNDGSTTPTPGDDIIWKFSASLPFEKEGSQYLQEGSDITYRLLLDEGVSYVKMLDQAIQEPVMTEVTEELPTGEVVKLQELIWTFKAPTSEEQQSAQENLGLIDLSLEAHVAKDVTVFKGLHIDGQATAQFIGGQFMTEKVSATLMVGSNSESQAPNNIGQAFPPAHRGAANGQGGITPNAGNSDPTVYEGDLLKWQMVYRSGLSYGQDYRMRFEHYTVEYALDSKLEFLGLEMSPNYYFPNSGVPSGVLISEEPKFDLYFKYLGELDYQTVPSVTNIKSKTSYSREELNTDPKKQVVGFKLTALDVPNGLYGDVKIVTMPQKNQTGKIINHGNQRMKGFVFNKGREIDYTYSEEGIQDNETGQWNENSDVWKKYMGERTANLVKRPTGESRIVSTSINLKKLETNQNVLTGENDVVLKIISDGTSLSVIRGPFVSYVTLPKGTTLNQEKLVDLAGEVTLVTDDFQKLGKELVKIVWKEEELRPNGRFQFKLPVNIDTERGPKNLNFEHYLATPDNENIDVPKTSEGGLTIKEQNNLDITGSGHPNEWLFKSIQSYVSVKNESVGISTELTNEKGETTQAGVVPVTIGEEVSVDLNLHKFSSTIFDKLVLITSLPSIGDSTLTTAENRESELETELLGPLVLPNEWQGKVTVFYSVAANPNVIGELTDNPAVEEMLKIKNPLNGSKAVWVEERDVIDFKKIKSIKIVSNDLPDNWLAGSQKRIKLKLKVPKGQLAKEDTQKVAFITGAVAVNKLLPTESTKVGMVVTEATEDKQLKIDYVDDWEFGQQEITGKSQSYFAKATLNNLGEPVLNAIQVSDFRGTHLGWHLKVRQDQQFYNDQDVLVGAGLSFESAGKVNSETESATEAPIKMAGELIPEGGAVDVLVAPAGQGMMTWKNQFGSELHEVDGEFFDSGVKLTVPLASVKLAKSYQTNLVWLLADIPGN